MADGGVAAEAYILRVLSLLTFFAKVSRHQPRGSPRRRRDSSERQAGAFIVGVAEPK
jgi:hypothetical protein